MSHTITGKLNKAARQYQGQNGMTFFVSLGEKNYDFKTKANAWTNYDVALFAKDAQIQFYNDALTEGAIVSVTGTGLILDLSNAEYPKLSLQDAKMIFVSGNQQPAQQGQQQGGYQAPQQQAPQQGFQPQAPQQGYQQPGK
tara:strand:+ start:235 stop:657 length:423 start_codon:yes stop_codon:yes gene_type:complete